MAMIEIAGTTALGIMGTITLEVREDDVVVDRRECRNLITTAGLVAIAQAVNWSGIEDQAANLGLNSPFYLAPLYGAVGTSTTAPAAADVALGAELARNPVTDAASATGQTTWSFFFGATQAVGTITEAGAFAGADPTAGSGTLLDHVLISPAITKTSVQTMTMQVQLSFASA